MTNTPIRTRASSSRLIDEELPTPRGSSRAASITPVRPRNRATSSTPTHSPHLSKADELAAEEAEEILEHVEGSARSRRHDRLSRLRDKASVDPVDDDGVAVSGNADTEVEEIGDEIVAVMPGSMSSQMAKNSPVVAVDDHPTPRSESPEVADGDLEAGDLPQAETPDDETDASDASSSSASDSDDSTSATSEGESGSDPDEEDDEDEELEKLLQAARIAASKSTAPKENEFAEGDEVVAFDKDDLVEQRRKEAPIPDISITALPKPHLSFTADGAAKAADARPIIAGPSRPKNATASSSRALELDDRPYERSLSKREKAAQPKKATASQLWSALPAPKADLLPQMKKDYQALALANSLDPKRFMKGGSRAGKIPDNFAIGTMVEAPRHVQDTTLTREKQYRPGQVVQNLIRDDATGSYAKRKYGDLQKTRMDNGRGRGWKKQKGW